MKNKTTPLFAVIETSNDKALNGKAPVMTVLRPMGWLMSAIYRWLLKRITPAEKIDLYLNPYNTEYVVELEPWLFSILAGSKKTSPKDRDMARRIKLVLTPSIDAKAEYIARQDGDNAHEFGTKVHMR